MFFTLIIWLAIGGFGLILAYLAGFSWVSQRDPMAVVPRTGAESRVRRAVGLWRKGDLPEWRVPRAA